jgi:hypothetical protein
LRLDSHKEVISVAQRIQKILADKSSSIIEERKFPALIESVEYVGIVQTEEDEERSVNSCYSVKEVEED